MLGVKHSLSCYELELTMVSNKFINETKVILVIKLINDSV